MDNSWIKSIAGARYHNGGWIFNGPSSRENYAHRKLLDVIPDLLDQAKRYRETFNLYRGPDKKLAVVEIESPRTGSLIGFGLMLQGTQVSLIRQESYLLETLTVVKDFETMEKHLHRFDILVDPFGDVTWQMDRDLTMTEEVIMKQLLKDVCQAAIFSTQVAVRR